MRGNGSAPGRCRCPAAAAPAAVAPAAVAAAVAPRLCAAAFICTDSCVAALTLRRAPWPAATPAAAAAALRQQRQQQQQHFGVYTHPVCPGLALQDIRHWEATPRRVPPGQNRSPRIVTCARRRLEPDAGPAATEASSTALQVCCTARAQLVPVCQFAAPQPGSCLNVMPRWCCIHATTCLMLYVASCRAITVQLK